MRCERSEGLLGFGWQRALASIAALAVAAQVATADAASDFAAACTLRADEARAAGRAVVRGEEGWLFLTSELRHLGVGPFWGEAAKTASLATRDDARDPLPVILDTARQLRERNIALLVVPVPPRAVVYADRLWPEAPKDAEGRPQRLDRTLAEFHGLLRAGGVDTLDLTDALLAARATDGAEGPAYCRQDSHWSPRGASVAAREIAAWLRARDLLPNGSLSVTESVETVDVSGDLWRLLDDPAAPRERLPLLRVAGAGGTPVAENPHSPLLLLADSHGLVFHEGGDMHAEGAGLSDHMSSQLGLAVDLMARRGSAATAVRIDLARRIRAEPDFATVKKAVVWCFAARELSESAGWRLVPLFPAEGNSP
jgi:alginate O-acetyltransferase complex protein AlgJ